MMQMMAENEWCLFWHNAGATGDNLRWRMNEAYYLWASAYASLDGVYHFMQHIDDCLVEYDQVPRLLEYLNEVKAALMYRDFVYDTHRHDNEQKSANIASNVAAGFWLPTFFSDCVKQHILATKHGVVPQDSDSKFVVDIDLSILGKEKLVFDLYEEAIRKEYSWVPEEIYKAKRAEVLQGFLDRSTIYATIFFRDKYQLQAEKNIKRAIAQL